MDLQRKTKDKNYVMTAQASQPFTALQNSRISANLQHSRRSLVDHISLSAALLRCCAWFHLQARVGDQCKFENIENCGRLTHPSENKKKIKRYSNFWPPCSKDPSYLQHAITINHSYIAKKIQFITIEYMLFTTTWVIYIRTHIPWGG